MENTFKIDCPVCKKELIIKIPDADIINQSRYSQIMVPHEKPIRCACGQAFVIGITNYSLSWSIQAIDEQSAMKIEGTKLIVPSSLVTH